MRMMCILYTQYMYMHIMSRCACNIHVNYAEQARVRTCMYMLIKHDTDAYAHVN